MSANRPRSCCFQTRSWGRRGGCLPPRQPLYTRSVARWKHYEKALGPLFDRLGDALATWATAAMDQRQH